MNKIWAPGQGTYDLNEGNSFQQAQLSLKLYKCPSINFKF